MAAVLDTPVDAAMESAGTKTGGAVEGPARMDRFAGAMHASPHGYILLYRGPPPPSGAVQRMLSNGHLRWQVLQCRQFEGLAGLGWSWISS